VAEVRLRRPLREAASVVKCEYVWKATDLWIEFPWSDKPPVATGSSGHTVLDA